MPIVVVWWEWGICADQTTGLTGFVVVRGEVCRVLTNAAFRRRRFQQRRSTSNTEAPQPNCLRRNADRLIHHTMLASLSAVQSLLNDTLRVTITDGRIFLGTFVGTDSELNILLLNTDEFRLGPNENPNGRFVGQVMIPWRLVNKVEARLSPQSPDGMFT